MGGVGWIFSIAESHFIQLLSFSCYYRTTAFLVSLVITDFILALTRAFAVCFPALLPGASSPSSGFSEAKTSQHVSGNSGAQTLLKDHGNIK